MDIETIKKRISEFIYEDYVDEFGACKKNHEQLFNEYIDSFSSPYGEDYISVETDILINHGPIAAAIIMALSYKSIDHGDRKEFSAVKISMISEIFDIPVDSLIKKIKELRHVYHSDGVFFAIKDNILYFFHDLSC